MADIDVPSRVLLVGNGARENALANAMLLNWPPEHLWVTPPNWGVLDPYQSGGRVYTLDLPATDNEGIVAAALERNIQLAVIGPDAPVVGGLADVLREAGIPTFGPGRAAARLEGSKSFAKHFMQRHGIPTADSQTFQDPQQLRDYLEAADRPLVLKADGLAAGKGVIVCDDRPQALAAFERMIEQREFGGAADTVVVEERLNGPEISFTCLIAGGRAEVLPPSTDYKRLRDGDQGPNTGGMGNICPTPWATDEVLVEFTRDILAPTLRGLAADGLDYRGFLFVGTMLTEQGLKVIEYNVRLGDPEAAVVLPLCRAPWTFVFNAAAHGLLLDKQIELQDGAAVAVALASANYPERKSPPQQIHGLDRVAARGLLDCGRDDWGHLQPSVSIYFAGVDCADGALRAAERPEFRNYTQSLAEMQYLASGGRILTISARGANLSEARRLAYEVVGNIQFEGMQYRSDIGQLR